MAMVFFIAGNGMQNQSIQQTAVGMQSGQTMGQGMQASRIGSEACYMTPGMQLAQMGYLKNRSAKKINYCEHCGAKVLWGHYCEHCGRRLV